jgi:hypothetical protein
MKLMFLKQTTENNCLIRNKTLFTVYRPHHYLCLKCSVTKGAFGSAVQPAFRRISNFFFFAKIECGLYLLDRFDVLISKIIFKK